MTQWMMSSVMHFLAAILIQTAPVDTYSGQSWTWGDDRSRWITLETATPKEGEVRYEFTLFEGEVRIEKGFALTAKKSGVGGWVWASWRETPDGRENRIATSLVSPKELPNTLRMPPWVAGREAMVRVKPVAAPVVTNKSGSNVAAPLEPGPRTHATYRSRELDLALTFETDRLIRLEATGPGTKPGTKEMVIHLETPLSKSSN